jgi:hypothetical protein
VNTSYSTLVAQLGEVIKVIVKIQNMFIKNTTPYVGHLKLKFEKYPNYTGGGSGVLNKIHLNLGFTKLVSRMVPYRNEDGWVVNSECTKLITKYTGGKIGTYTSRDGEHKLPNSFMSNDGTYIGDIETAWWYYNNNLYVCKENPNGVAIKLKSYNPKITLVNYIEDNYENFITEQIENDNIEGYYGYTHRGGALIKIGDRVFDNYYLPVRSDYTQKEWDGYYEEFKKSLKKADELNKDWITVDGIASVIPFNRRGKKVIKNWKDALEAAINLSKYLG